METEKTYYYGELIVDKGFSWSKNTEFELDPLELFNLIGDFALPPVISDLEILSTWRRPMIDDGTRSQEWQVLREGKWMDSVYFSPDTDAEYVRESLINQDNYPGDIVVLKVERK